MADIAMLVAEEYERRIKNSGKGESSGEVDLFSGVSIRAPTLQASSWLKQKVNGHNFGEESLQLFKWVLEPKSQIGVAAISGFFSA